MHVFIRTTFGLSLLMFASGCVALAVGAVGGAAGVTYAKGKLTDKLDAPVAQVHAATVMALHRSTVPPSLNTAPADPVSRFRFVKDDPVDARIDRAISFGMALSGGQRAALVLRRFEE